MILFGAWWGWASKMYDLGIGLFQACWNFIYGLITAPTATMLASLESVFPSLGNELAIVGNYIGMFNYLIDVDLCLTATGGYIGFLATWTTYKHVKSWIPTVAGT